MNSKEYLELYKKENKTETEKVLLREVKVLRVISECVTSAKKQEISAEEAIDEIRKLLMSLD